MSNDSDYLINTFDGKENDTRARERRVRASTHHLKIEIRNRAVTELQKLLPSSGDQVMNINEEVEYPDVKF